jgi:hypothetical protein
MESLPNGHMTKGKAAADSLLLIHGYPATYSKKRFYRSGVNATLGLRSSAEPVLIFKSLQVDDPLEQFLYGLGALSLGKLQQIYNQPSRYRERRYLQAISLKIL